MFSDVLWQNQKAPSLVSYVENAVFKGSNKIQLRKVQKE